MVFPVEGGGDELSIPSLIIFSSSLDSFLYIIRIALAGIYLVAIKKNFHIAI